MANGQIEIHDPFVSHKDAKDQTDGDRTSTSDTDNVENLEEFRLLMAYAQRRRLERGAESPARDRPAALNGNTDIQKTPAKTETETSEKNQKKKKKKKKKRGWSRFFCIKPQAKGEDPPETQGDVSDRCGNFIPAKEEKDYYGDVASWLMRIADDIQFTPPELEADSPDDDVERMIGLLLRESGDRLNERELKNLAIAKELFCDYSFFKKIITTLLTRLGLGSFDSDAPGPRSSPKTEIAVACEATCRLSAMDTLPMSRLLGYGARYLNEYYPSWVQQQGGPNATIEHNDDDDDDDDTQ